MVMYNPSPPDSLKYFRNGAGAAAKQYGGERATYDNKFIIVKGDLAMFCWGNWGPQHNVATFEREFLW